MGISTKGDLYTYIHIHSLFSINFTFYLFNMSPFLFSMGQETIDRIHQEEVVRQHIEKFGVPASVTGVSSPGLPSSPVVVADEADLSVHSDSESTHEEATIDQSVNGISFINLHWASISTRISSILAVVVLCLIIAGC